MRLYSALLLLYPASFRAEYAAEMQGIFEKRRAEGLAAIQQAIDLRPRRPQGWLSLARALDSAGLPADAARCRRLQGTSACLQRLTRRSGGRP